MTEALVKQLQAENDRLKKRVRLLEKRLAKFRKKTNDLEDEIEELDILAEIKTTLNTKVKSDDRCPQCGRELQYHSLPFGELVLCSNETCKYRSTNFRKSK